MLPRYLSKWVTGKVVASGVQVTPEVGVEHATLDSGERCSKVFLKGLRVVRLLRQTYPPPPLESGKVKLQLSNGSHILADHVLVAVGLQPNTELAEKVRKADPDGKLCELRRGFRLTFGTFLKRLALKFAASVAASSSIRNWRRAATFGRYVKSLSDTLHSQHLHF